LLDILDESRELADQIIAFINRHATDTDNEDSTEQEFNELALKIFRFQFERNPAYRRFCQLRRKAPLSVRHWTEVPPMPIQGFKELTLSCMPIEQAEAVFMTSGTTDPEKKGRNYHPYLDVWDASMAPPFKRFVLPDRDKMTMYVISPAADMNRYSSLSRYLSLAVERYGSDRSRFFFDENGLDMAALVEALRESEENGEPVLLLGATFAYVHLLDYCADRQFHVRLPEGSRMFDTGGFKGQSREVDMQELYGRFHTLFGVSRNLCINMYGMTELCSQFYDQTIISTMRGAPDYSKTGPAWLRTVVLDSDSLEPVPNGKQGLLAHYDLANWNASLAILTEDIGCRTETGFVLLGRAGGSEARGCSIAVDQLLQAKNGWEIRE
jgi:hypothetical protein